MRSRLGLQTTRTAALFLFSVLAGSMLAMPASAQRYTVYDIGTLGGPNSFIFYMSPEGVVTGTSNLPDGTSHGFRLSGFGPLTAANSLGGLGGSFAFAGEINSRGDIVGIATPPPVGNAARRAVVFRADGTVTDLGALAGSSRGFGINDAGDVVGHTGVPGGTDLHAFVAPGGGPMIDLGTFGGAFSEATDINNAGVIVGTAENAAGVRRAFRHVGTGPLNAATDDLGTFGGAGSVGRFISESGVILGQAQTADGAFHAFRLVGPGPLNAATDDLGVVSGFTNSVAWSMNQSGNLILGELYNTNLPNSTNHAFVWDAVNGMRDLNTLLDPGTGAGWELVQARGASADGSLIAGWGFHNGAPRGFILQAQKVIPEPGTLALAASSLLSLVGVLVRRQRHGGHVT
jgi:probable HAF family extracellular repeat protein